MRAYQFVGGGDVAQIVCRPHFESLQVVHGVVAYAVPFVADTLRQGRVAAHVSPTIKKVAFMPCSRKRSSTQGVTHGMGPSSKSEEYAVTIVDLPDHVGEQTLDEFIGFDFMCRSFSVSRRGGSGQK